MLLNSLSFRAIAPFRSLLPPSFSSSSSPHSNFPNNRQSFVMAVVTTGNRIFSPRNSFTRVLLATFICALIFIFSYRHSADTLQPIPEIPHIEQFRNGSKSVTAHLNPPDCTIDTPRLLSLQEKYNLSDIVEYGQRFIRTKQGDVERKSLTRLDQDLFPKDFDVLDFKDPALTSKCLAPLEVTVPRSSFPRTADASSLLFGISTTYKRLTDEETTPLKEWAHWLTDGQGNSNGAGLILRLVDASDSQLADTQRILTQMGIDVKVSHSNSAIEMAQRYLSLLPALYNDDSRKRRRWLVMCDDDTFFPSMNSLLARLSQFNHEADMYIGTFSEDVFNIQRHGSQAFGGAGVFFSLKMAETVSELYDQCSTAEKVKESNTGWGPQGDILLRKCIYENTEVRLTMMTELHQLDIQGDPSGFYESGLQPLSLHHFKGGIWHKAKPYAGAQVVHACGEACFLQRFWTKDDFVIANGYSVAFYPQGLQFDINQIERTFHPAPNDYGWNLDFMLGGPGRKSLVGSGRKVAWELKEAYVGEDGSVRQSYIRLANDRRWTENGEPMFDLDGIVELIWMP